jgi:glutaredoxin
MKAIVRHLVRLIAFAAIAVVIGPPADAAEASERSVRIYLFWQSGCPYCEAATRELNDLAESNAAIETEALEIGVSEETDALYIKLVTLFEEDRPAVPFVIIGDRSFLGHLDGGRSATLYRNAAERCFAQACPDIVEQVRALSDALREGARGPPPAQPEPTRAAKQVLPETLHLPLIGEIRTADLSLPILTVVLAAIDGFNPCAMWVLVFLIGLLMGLESERRMWLLGGAFLGATAAMYFAVMAAWLNLVLLLGTAVWLRVAVAILALGGGAWYLREYWTQPEAVCRVTSPGLRQRIMATFRSVVNSHRLPLAVVGIMALAVLVNFVELLCSAGIPAVYTKVLTLSELSAAAYYGYIGLYIVVFMLDDFAIFATAMFALRVTGLTGGYARYSHLIGGIVLLGIGAVMLLRPDWLTFA